MFRRLRTGLALGLVAAFGLVGCDDSTGPSGDARLTVLMTDAPSDYFSSVTVDVGAIEIVRQGGPPVTLTDDGGMHDLLELQNGVTAELASLSIEPGTYLQLRLVVESATVTLVDSLQFNDGTRTRELFVPSGAQSGIKINLSAADNDGSAGVEIASGRTILVVDFDVSQNFVLQGNPGTEAGFEDVLFTPLLRATVRDIAGSISGTVTSDADGTGLEGLTVRATLLTSEVMEELQTAEATAVTDSVGDYTIRFLSPGDYEVAVDSFTAATQTVTVGEDEDVTDVDFTGSAVTPTDGT